MSLRTTPFISAEEAWFWFMQANQARNDGARFAANAGNIIRPCEPDDILTILNRLYRNRRIDMNHLRVLRYYGLRMTPPDRFRPREHLAWRLWRDSMDIMGEILIPKGIVVPSLSAEVISFNERKAQREAFAW